tara:strand:+ start:1399 stop:1653 length:255 start_codon:yes stop_codon:yes gene_type:complete
MDYIKINDENDECLICFDPMNKKKDKLIYCKYCSNYVHKKCFDLWLEQNISDKKKCIYCQQKGGLFKKNISFFSKIKKKICFFL